MIGILWGVVVLLVAVWALGFALHLVGSIIHIVLLIAIALAIYNFATSRDRRQ
jgi:hypothetical protein